MAISVRDLSVHSMFQNEFLMVAGFDGLDNIISCISVIDTPLIPLPAYKLKEGVFVLSSFYLYRESQEQILKAVKNLVAIGVSAIGVKTDLFIHELPAEVLAFCNSVNVPLFQLNNKDIPFRKIISVVESIIHESERSDKFFDSFLNGNIHAAFHSMAQNVMAVNFVCVTTDLDVIVKYSPCSEPNCDVLVKRAKELLGESNLAQQFHLSKGYLQRGFLYVFPCYVHNILEAIMIFEHPTALGKLLCSKIKDLTNILSLQLLENILIEKGRNSVMVDRVNDYLLREYSSENFARVKFELLSFPSKDNYRLVLFVYQKLSEEISYYCKRRNITLIEQRVSALFPKSILFKAFPNLVLLVPIGENTKYVSNITFRRVLEKIQPDCAKHGFNEIKYTEVQSQLCLISKVYSHLLQVVKSGSQREDNTDGIELVRNFDSISLLSALLSSNYQWMLRDAVVIPIMQYDEKYHSELWNTLEVCLTLDKLELAATTLHIHSSTLRYRLQKIETLTGYNYFKFLDKIVLYFASVLHAIEP